jgi:hypothetical protein
VFVRKLEFAVNRIAGLVVALSGLWIVALLMGGLPIGLDELEYFRATRWVSLGSVPFVDFWEHHTPLQWLIFAPAARLADGAGVGSIVLMRWMQVPLWVGLISTVVGIARRAGLRARDWALSLLLILASPTFVERAIEYRVDVLANLAFVAAIAFIAFGATRWRWIAFGALMSAAVLANARLAPLVVVAGVLALWWRAEERKWGWNPRALWMSVGIVAVATAFFTYLSATSSLNGFIEGAIGYNRLSSHVLAVNTFADALLAPLWAVDLAGIAFWVAGVAGLVLVLRDFKRPGPLQVLAILTLAGIVGVAAMQVQYDYHFQNTWVLLLPMAAFAIERLPRPWWRRTVVAAGLAGVLVSMARTAPTFGAAMRYQNDVMTAVDRLTLPGETVFDGAGYALRRKPAWRYWFLTTGVRFLAARGEIERYDAPQMAEDPPAAVIADYRMILYLQLFPRLQAYALRHYVPVYRNLWVPGMTAMIGPSVQRVAWTSPRGGVYDVYASDLLAKHPWFTRPLESVTTIGPRAALLEIPLNRLPRYEAAHLQWSVDGVLLPSGMAELRLRKGSRVELVGDAPSPTGVLLVPHGISVLCTAPEEETVF